MLGLLTTLLPACDCPLTANIRLPLLFLVNAYTCCKTNDYRAPLADSIILNGITFVIGDSFCIPLSKLSKNVYGKQPFLKVKDENGIEVFVENLIWEETLNVHGHIHSNPSPEGPYKCVCVEQTDFKPVALEDIRVG